MTDNKNTNIAKTGSTSLGTIADAMKAREQTVEPLVTPPRRTVDATPPQAPAVDPVAALQAEIARLQAENAALAKKKSGGGGHPSFKVSEKGAISVYGLGRFPVTLYFTQWQRLFSDEVRADFDAFVKENEKNPKLIREKPAKAAEAEAAPAE